MVDQDVVGVGPQVSDAPGGRPRWMPFGEFPFASRYARIGGHRIHHVDEGAGPPLLLVCDGAEAFLWRDVIVRLRESFRCVGVDLQGTGRSTVTDLRRPGVEEAARVLVSFVRRLDLRDVTLIVHGVAGPVGLAAAARMPDRIRGLAAVETSGWTLPRREGLRCAPVLLVFGAESPAVSERAPERWRERFPDAELLLVDGGHDVPMARAPDLVARALIGWWKEEVGRP